MNPNPPISSARSIAGSCRSGTPGRKGVAGLLNPALLPAAVAGLLASFAGCAHVADVRDENPGFTAEALRAGGLVDLGVVQVNEVPQVRPPLIEALERVLAATRSDIRLIPAVRAQATFDDSTSRLLLLGYQMHGAPDPVWLARAADSLRGVARYGVLARIESDVTRSSVRDAPPNNPSLQSPSGRILISGRDARVSVRVYELATRAPVFDGTYRASAESASVDSSRLSAYPGRSREQGGIIVTPQTPSSQQGYPEPPPLARAVEAAFLEFARSLPGGPRP
ncbi:MAG: hypothetical protein E6K79_07515 [Candidatus Eisenbacteria bacterium]|uniref:Uncharacterized protein n=1 Tax=Eiseniibacteriota bacterium TaxID=2212470 RepID=A0A538TLN4_UNCEI|nr:MAG: hypothetical protein E6K79_07515 [Candidatus Eisenbacteria bacterium]